MSKTQKKIKKKNKRIYFGLDVQDAIVMYNNETNPIIKNQIYKDEIAYAFDKLVENIINTFKFSYFDARFEDVKQEVVSFLVLNMHKYDGSKGFKAFSYFSVVAKNYLIAVNNNNYKKMKLNSDLNATTTLREITKTHRHIESSPFSTSEFIDEMIKYFDTNIPTMFKKKRDIDIAYSITEILKKRDEIDNYNKKSLYILIREMTGVNTSYITKVVGEMKRRYYIIAEKFYSTGNVSHVAPTKINKFF